MLPTPEQELQEVRRVLCATPLESAYAAARRVVHRNLETRLSLSRLMHRLERQGALLDKADDQVKAWRAGLLLELETIAGPNK